MAYPLKYISTRLSSFIVSWEQNAPDAVFGGMTLEEFKEATAESTRIRDKIMTAEMRLQALRVRRDDADKVTMAKMDLVVNSVRGTPEYGSNSGLYRALGYIPTSERKSGLVRKRKKKPSDDAPA